MCDFRKGSPCYILVGESIVFRGVKKLPWLFTMLCIQRRQGMVQKSLLSYSPARTETLARQYYSTHNFHILCLLDALNYILRKCGNTLVSFQCLKEGGKDLCYCHLIKLQQCLIRKRHPIRQILEWTSSYKRSLNELGQETTLSKNWTMEIFLIFAQPLKDNFPQWHLCFRIC